MSATAFTNDLGSAGTARAQLVRWLHLDAAVSGAAGLAVAAGAPWLDDLLGAPPRFLVPVGIFLVVYAGALVLLGRAGAPSAAVIAVIAGNTVWVVASLAAVADDWLTLTGVGTTFTLLQAAVVAALAELQFVALRRAR